MTTLRVLITLILAAQATFRSGTDVVAVDVSVRRGNTPVASLTAADFRVYDNGVPQTIGSLSTGTVPIDATVVLEINDEVFQKVDGLKDDLVRIAALLRPDDRLRVITTNDQVRVIGWQPGGQSVAMGDVGIGMPGSANDALLLSLMHRPDFGRRGLIFAITSDKNRPGWGVDSAAVRDVARRAEAVLHVVIVHGWRSDQTAPAASSMWYRNVPDPPGYANFKEAALSTGGRLYESPLISSRDRIVNAFDAALEDFRHSYVLHFTPTGVKRPGWHDLQVEAPGAGRATVRARRGYFGG